MQTSNYKMKNLILLLLSTFLDKHNEMKLFFSGFFFFFLFKLLEKHICIYIRNNHGFELSGSLSDSPSIWVTTIGKLSPHTSGFRSVATNIPTVLCKYLQELGLERGIVFLQMLKTFWLHHSCKGMVQFTKPYERMKKQHWWLLSALKDEFEMTFQRVTNFR